MGVEGVIVNGDGLSVYFVLLKVTLLQLRL